MSIVSTTAAKEPHLQRDGRVWVNERHTDHLGNQYPATYLAAGNITQAQINAIAAARATQIAADLARQEAEDILNGIGT